MNRTILYLHGMGGGTDSRIPGILQEHFAAAAPSVRVICRTYDFDPAVAHPVIRAWVDELRPDLIIGESLGSIHALRIPGIPKLLVSPALGGPMRLVRLAPWTLIPGVGWICRRFIWRVKRPGRQVLRFRYRILRNYRAHYEALLAAAKEVGPVHAFIGDNDHYKKSGVVSRALWEQLYGPGTVTAYPGTHFMEEQFIHQYLIPSINAFLYKYSVNH